VTMQRLLFTRVSVIQGILGFLVLLGLCHIRGGQVRLMVHGVQMEFSNFVYVVF